MQTYKSNQPCNQSYRPQVADKDHIDINKFFEEIEHFFSKKDIGMKIDKKH
jgi:hypothetical protein